ncbi:MAG TPA: SDR family NAD(P)-dependent oxidoreductase, partial [Arthrobacter sp.]|nr:SDR family NAD(P)-dependent oxidoreductase [Arthrobacter sp.]
MLSVGRTAVVSGATGGIGGPLVDELLARGIAVVALGRDQKRMAELAAHPGVETVEWDAAARPAVPEVVSSLERVDVLIHTAGIAPLTRVADMRSEDLTRLLALNVMSAATLTAAVLPALREAGGHVVFVNSSSGLSGRPGWSGYLGSKAALRELADSLRIEEEESGVKVTTVYPGAVATDLLRRVREAFNQDYDPEDCVSAGTAARLIASLLDHPTDGYLTEVSFT